MRVSTLRVDNPNVASNYSILVLKKTFPEQGFSPKVCTVLEMTICTCCHHVPCDSRSLSSTQATFTLAVFMATVRPFSFRALIRQQKTFCKTPYLDLPFLPNSFRQLWSLFLSGQCPLNNIIYYYQVLYYHIVLRPTNQTIPSCILRD